VSRPDPVSGLVAFLAATSAVTDLTGNRIYGGEIAKAAVPQMPRASIVVSPAGGLGAFGGGWQEYGDRRFDVDCYAATEDSSHELYIEAHQALKQMEAHNRAGIRLHWARPAAGGNTGRDPRNDWPVTLSSWQVLASEIAVPA